MRLRHGGNTEGGNADLAETRQRALSGYKTATIIALSTKQTMKQRRTAARKRLAERTKGGICRNEPGQRLAAQMFSAPLPE
jgi:hypothetical protein